MGEDCIEDINSNPWSKPRDFYDETTVCPMTIPNAWFSACQLRECMDCENKVGTHKTVPERNIIGKDNKLFRYDA